MSRLVDAFWDGPGRGLTKARGSQDKAITSPLPTLPLPTLSSCARATQVLVLVCGLAEHGLSDTAGRDHWAPVVLPLVRARLGYFSGPQLSRLLQALCVTLRVPLGRALTVRQRLLPAARRALHGLQSVRQLCDMMEGLAAHDCLAGGGNGEGRAGGASRSQVGWLDGWLLQPTEHC